jgi:hypothetical protein
MAITLNCTNPKCGKWQDPILDVKSNKVYCSVCDCEQNVSHFTKINLKSVGQVKKATKSAYSVRCSACKWEALPKIVGAALCCPQCSAQHKGVSVPFQMLIKQEIKKASSDE